MRIHVFSTRSTNLVPKFGRWLNPSHFQILCIQPKYELIRHRRTSNMNLQKEVSTVGSLKELAHQHHL